jgi:DNA-binding beta-propeller fold protein YncE
VFDVASGKLTNTVLIGSQTTSSSLYSLAVTPNGQYLYVPIYYNGSTPGNTVLMLNAVTQEIVGSPITVGNGPSFIAITPNGDDAYVLNQNDETISVINITVP